MNNIISYTRNWGNYGHEVEPRGRPEHGPAQRRLRHLHRADHRTQRRQPQRAGRLHRRVLRHGPAHEVRQAGRVPDRLDRQRNDPQRRVEEPGRLEGARRLQRHVGSAQSVKVVWGNESFTYSIPAATSATFTWSRHPGQRRRRPHRRDHRVRRQVRRRRRRQHRQRHRRSSSTPATAPPRRAGRSAPTAPSARSASAWTWPRPAPPTAPRSSSTTATAPAPKPGRPSGTQLINPVSGKCLDATGPSCADGTPLQIWSCAGGANQQWSSALTSVGNRLRRP